MTAAVTDDTKTHSKEVNIKQKTENWETTVDWPKDIADTAKGTVKVGGKATITFTPAGTGKTGGTVKVSYSAGTADTADTKKS